MKRLIFATAVILGLILTAEQTERWALEKLSIQVKKETGLNFQAGSLRISILPLGLSLANIKLSDSDTTLAMNAHRASASLSWQSLWKGRLFLSEVRLSEVHIESRSNSETPLDVKEVFKQIKNLPIRYLILEGFSFTDAAESPPQKISLLKATAHNHSTSLEVSVEKLITNYEKLTLQTSLVALINEEGFNLDLTLETANSSQPLNLDLNGRSRWKSKPFVGRSSINLTFNSSFDLKNMTSLNLPEDFESAGDLRAKGNINAIIDWNKLNLRVSTGQSRIDIKNLVFHEEKIGDYLIPLVIGDFEYKNKRLLISSLELKTKGGDKLNVANGKINFGNEQWALAFEIASDSLQLRNLFRSLELEHIPLDVNLRSSFPCQGALRPSFFLSCFGDVETKNLQIWDDDNNMIVSWNDALVSGEFSVDKDQLFFSSALQRSGEIAQVEGTIPFEENFSIRTNSEHLSLAPMGPVSDLIFEGAVAFDITVEGHSEDAWFEGEVQAKDGWMENWPLGDFSSSVSYSNRLLNLPKVSGVLKETEFQGGLSVDLREQQLNITDGHLKLELNNLKHLFSRHIDFPLNLGGKTDCSVKAHGGFDFFYLTYQMDCFGERIDFENEGFKNLKVSIESQEGIVNLKEGRMEKGSSLVTGQGQIINDQTIDASLSVKEFRLEKSDNLLKLTDALRGNLNVEARFQGPLIRPKSSFNLQLSKVLVANRSVPDSYAIIELSPGSVKSSFQLIGRRIQGDLTLPLRPDHPLDIDLSIFEWDYSSFLSFFGGEKLRDEYSTQLTGHLKLSSKKGSLSQANGNLEIQRLVLQRSPFELRNPKSIVARIRDGNIELENLLLKGPKSQLIVNNPRLSFDDFATSGTLITDLELLHIFFPFLTTVNGPVRVRFSTEGPLLDPKTQAFVQTDGAYVAIPGFPHPFERVRGLIEIIGRKVDLRWVNADLGKGAFSGYGTVAVDDSLIVESDISMSLSDSELEIVPEILTKMSGDLKIQGQGLPLPLKGTVKISEGSIKNSFDEKQKLALDAQSVFLPEEVHDPLIDPLELDIQVVTEKPLTVENPFVSGTTEVDLTIQGKPKAPILKGQVDLQPGTRLIFRDRVFSLRSGKLIFQGQRRIDPEVFVAADTRVDPYNVELLVQGTSSNPRIRLTSQPSLSEPNIISLLAMGATFEQSEEIDFAQQAAQGTYRLGSVLIEQNPIARTLEEKYGLEVSSSSVIDERNVAVPMIGVKMEVSPQLMGSVNSTIQNPSLVEAKVQYLLNQRLSAVGTFEQKAEGDLSGFGSSHAVLQNVFGLFLDFKMEFE